MTTITLSKEFNYNSILFKWEKHVNNSLKFFAERLNRKYGGIELKDDEMWNLLFHNPGNNHKELKSDVVELLWDWYLDKVFTLASAVVTTNLKADIKTKMDLAPLQAVTARNTKVGIRNAAQLAKMFNSYN